MHLLLGESLEQGVTDLVHYPVQTDLKGLVVVSSGAEGGLIFA